MIKTTKVAWKCAVSKTTELQKEYQWHPDQEEDQWRYGHGHTVLKKTSREPRCASKLVKTTGRHCVTLQNLDREHWGMRVGSGIYDWVWKQQLMTTTTTSNFLCCGMKFKHCKDYWWLSICFTNPASAGFPKSKSGLRSVMPLLQ